MANQSFGGDWTEQKLGILNDYLAAYCTIFQSNPAARHLDTIYVDAFAGGGLIQQPAARKAEERLFGEFVEQDAVAFLKGSAARALHHTFTRYVFIEKSELRIAELEKLKTQSSAGSQISIRRGDGNKRWIEFSERTIGIRGFTGQRNRWTSLRRKLHPRSAWRTPVP